MEQKLPIDLTKKIGVSKEEIEKRRAQEQAVLTKIPLSPTSRVQEDPIALKEFMRLKGLLGIINRDDALYQNIVCTYAIVYSEIEVLQAEWDRRNVQIASVTTDYNPLNTQMMQRRKHLLDLEKQMYLTPAAAVLKAPTIDKRKNSKMSKFAGK